MTSLDGEYMLIGRKTEDISNIFVQYGQGVTRTVNLTGGNDIQEAEFIDGLRFSIDSDHPFNMNVDIINGVAKDALPPNTASLSKKHCIDYLKLRYLNKVRFIFMGSKHEYPYSGNRKRRAAGSV